MRFLLMTLLCCMLNVFSADSAFEYPPLSPTILKPITINSTTTNDVERGATNIILQSKDGGQSWQDISNSLPEIEQPESFFAGGSDVYLRVNNKMYRSKSNLNTPVWEKEYVPAASIVFNRSGVMAYNYEGQVYQKTPAGTWLPIHTNFKKNSMRTIFETSGGTVFMGYDHGLYKSADQGQSWKQVQHEGWVMDIVESEGVLIGTGQKGIMRSTDNGDHWEWVISEGGVGIAIEHIKGGFAAISYSETTKSRRVRISMDSGKTWKSIDEGIHSLFISSIKQMGEYLILGHPEGIYRSSDMGKTWNIVLLSEGVLLFPSSDMGETPNIVHSGDSVFQSSNMGKTSNTADSNAGMKVFKIYVSGNVLYAVAVNAGC